MIATASDRRQYIHRLRNQVRRRSTLGGRGLPRDGGARGVVRSLLAPLAPTPAAPPAPTGLDTLQKVLAAISEAEEERILSPKEADAVLRFTIMKFVERQAEEVLAAALLPSRSDWFVIAGERQHD